MKEKINMIWTMLAVFCMLSLGSCVQDRIINSETGIESETKEIIRTNIYGQVLNVSGSAIANATVNLHTHEGTTSVLTDNFGNFEVLDFLNPGPSAYLTVEAANYFDGFRRMAAIPTKYNFTRIRLLDKTVVGTIPAATGGQVQTAEGMLLELPAKAVVDANNAAYSGNVNVAMAWIDPASPNLPDLMVGDLSGRALDGSEASLGSFGMVQVELYDDANRELNIAPNVKAKLSFPVPASRMTAAPQDIPLWSYDELDGVWREEEVAYLEGNRYVGSVSHFSSWNVGNLFDDISINGHVTMNNTGSTLNLRLQILVCSDLIGIKGGWMDRWDDSGDFLFYNFPQDEEFTLKLLNNCGDVIYEATYGPYTSDTDLGDIQVDVSSLYLSSFTGTAVNCNQEPVTNGYIHDAVEASGYINFASITDGTFQLDFVLCDPAGTIDLTYNIVDLDESIVSPESVVTLSLGTNDAGSITVCEDISEFFVYTIEGQYDTIIVNPYPYFSEEDSLNSIGINSSPNSSWLTFDFKDFDPTIDGLGEYNPKYVNYYYLDRTGSSKSAYSDDSDFTVTITEYGENLGDIIRGTFTGSFELFHEQTSQGVKQVAGSFKVIRE